MASNTPENSRLETCIGARFQGLWKELVRILLEITSPTPAQVRELEERVSELLEYEEAMLVQEFREVLSKPACLKEASNIKSETLDSDDADGDDVDNPLDGTGHVHAGNGPSTERFRQTSLPSPCADTVVSSIEPEDFENDTQRLNLGEGRAGVYAAHLCISSSEDKPQAAPSTMQHSYSTSPHTWRVPDMPKSYSTWEQIPPLTTGIFQDASTSHYPPTASAYHNASYAYNPQFSQSLDYPTVMAHQMPFNDIYSYHAPPKQPSGYAGHSSDGWGYSTAAPCGPTHHDYGGQLSYLNAQGTQCFPGTRNSQATQWRAPLYDIQDGVLEGLKGEMENNAGTGSSCSNIHTGTLDTWETHPWDRRAFKLSDSVAEGGIYRRRSAFRSRRRGLARSE